MSLNFEVYYCLKPSRLIRCKNSSGCDVFDDLRAYDLNKTKTITENLTFAFASIFEEVNQFKHARINDRFIIALRIGLAETESSARALVVATALGTASDYGSNLIDHGKFLDYRYQKAQFHIRIKLIYVANPDAGTSK